MATVDLEHVHKTYEGGFEAVRDFNLAIKEREFIVLVGPSGCGKSTTLRMIAGLEEITSGTISIGGKVMNKVAPKDRDIAMVFQSYALYPHMTVFENMAFALKLRKLPKAAIADKVQPRGRRARHRQRARQAAQAAVGRPAAARRARARDRARAALLPVRRAAVQPRRQAARRDARRDQAPAPRAGQHDRLRHARSGGGDHARRSRGRHEGRRSSSSARARSTSTTTPRTGSSPASWERRR